MASRRKPYQDIHKVLKIDSSILNYSTCLPTKLLGNKLIVANVTDYEQIIELTVDSSSYLYSRQEIHDGFKNRQQGEELPFKIEKNSIVNSELKYESWYIENPVSQELTKRITLKLGAKSQQDFIIVIRCPAAKKPLNLLSIVNVGLLTYPHEQFGVKDSFEDCLKYQYNSSMKNFLSERKHLSQEQRTSILLAAQVAAPKLVCPKEFWVDRLHTEVHGPQKVIFLAVKKSVQLPVQKFRIPFKMSGFTGDIDFAYQFDKTASYVSPSTGQFMQS